MSQNRGLHFELLSSKAQRDEVRALGMAHGEMARHIANRILDVLCPWDDDHGGP